MRLSKTMLLASSMLLCAACGGDKTTIKTSVEMGFTTTRLGGWLRDEDKTTHYTVVKYAFTASSDYTLKATDFTITNEGKKFEGKFFALGTDDPEYPAVVTKKAEEQKLSAKMYVLFDQELPWDATDPTGTIKDNTGIKLFTAKDITFKK